MTWKATEDVFMSTDMLDWNKLITLSIYSIKPEALGAQRTWLGLGSIVHGSQNDPSLRRLVKYKSPHCLKA